MTIVQRGQAAGEALEGSEQLLRRLERRWAADGSRYAVERCLASAEQRRAQVERAVALLGAAAWEQRNLAVKLLGLLQAREHVDLVVEVIVDRTPAGWLARLFGGDFRQVGFIRRNALAALARLGVVTDEVERGLVVAMGDPYYEARAEAARTTAVLGGQLATRRGELLDALERCTRDASIEVAAAAAEAIGAVGEGERAAHWLVGLAEARFWKVRAAALAGLLRLVERRACGDIGGLEQAVRRFVLTSTDFQPHFQIKHTYGVLLAAIAAEKGSLR
jgi:UDP-N-acetylglucosamine--N-acetylmuramyl-(pentapeptide) pyrophosphoryl-undecaprenol N-acetylglucosamine transferase